jgi:hypothetical protein
MAPYYNSQSSTSIANWPTNKLYPGTWGCAEGKWVKFCIPSKDLKTVTDPKPILDYYDQIYEAYHILRGTLPTSMRIQWIVSDILPSAGYMHSGYPIVTMMDVATSTNNNFVFNLNYLKTNGHWGFFH